MGMTNIVFAASGRAEFDKITVDLSDATIKKLFAEAFEGWCPICNFGRINDGEIICCDCLTKAMAYHRRYCDCLDTDENDEAR